MTKTRRHLGCHVLILAAWMLVAILSVPAQAAGLFAYVGPGAGLGMISALIAVVAVIILGLLGPILYPIRLFLNWYRQRNQVEGVASETLEDAAATTEHPAK